jgi:hypothetical protein
MLSGLLRGSAGALLAASGVGPAWATNGVGAWSELADWPLIAIHAMVLPDGKVLT